MKRYLYFKNGEIQRKTAIFIFRKILHLKKEFWGNAKISAIAENVRTLYL